MIDHFPRNPETGRAMLPEAEFLQPCDEASPVMFWIGATLACVAAFAAGFASAWAVFS